MQEILNETTQNIATDAMQIVATVLGLFSLLLVLSFVTALISNFVHRNDTEPFAYSRRWHR